MLRRRHPRVDRARPPRVRYTPRVHLDLHRHLEGSHSAAALVDVARELGLRAPPFYDAAADRFVTAAELAAATTVTTPSDDPAALIC